MGGEGQEEGSGHPPSEAFQRPGPDLTEWRARAHSATRLQLPGQRAGQRLATQGAPSPASLSRPSSPCTGAAPPEPGGPAGVLGPTASCGSCRGFRVGA